jgi:hypothetical protein
VIKKLRENKKPVKRVLYVAKLDEQGMKGEIEKDMTNYFKALAEEDELGGLNLIIGPYNIHLLECDAKVSLNILRKVNETASQPNSLYH